MSCLIRPNLSSVPNEAPFTSAHSPRSPTVYNNRSTGSVLFKISMARPLGTIQLFGEPQRLLHSSFALSRLDTGAKIGDLRHGVLGLEAFETRESLLQRGIFLPYFIGTNEGRQ